MRVKCNSIKKISFLSKKILFLLAVFFIFSIVSLYAQNGIPIDVLQNDPYFRSGSTDKALEQAAEEEAKEAEEKAKIEAEETSTENAEQSNTAKDTANSTTDEESTTTNLTLSEETKDSLENKENSEAVTIPKTIQITDDIVDAKIDISLGYMAFCTYEIEKNGIASYFDMNNFYNINPYGAAFRIEFMTLPSLLGVNGFGVNATWSPMKKTSEHYTIKTNLITANIFFVHKVRFPHTRLMLEFHIGGGGMMFLYPTFTYETGYEPQSYNWIYPEAVAGFAFQKYFTRHWGVDFTVDVAYPFLVEVPFPVAQVTLSSGWHF